MLRFILKRSEANYEYNRTSLETHDLWVPELEALLLRGGKGDCGHDMTELVGVEVLSADEVEP
jgi:hypothetical protein